MNPRDTRLDAAGGALRPPPSFDDKVAFLSRADAYPGGTRAVEVIRTHMSVVFLTDMRVYKLKKPVRRPFLDFSTLEARRFDCEEEVRLNRRLAPDVYLGVVPLACGPGGLGLGAAGTVVEWLVEMRRLPRELMLDAALRRGTVTDETIGGFAALLARFYAGAPRAPIAPAAYRRRERDSLDDHARALATPAYALDRARLDAVVASQARFIDERGDLLEARVRAGRVVEGHGDLRPEHVCLTRPPVIIDCLEFDPRLRWIDPVDELGYLAMECEFMGFPRIGGVVMRTYRDLSGDDADPALARFHRAQRALLRAKLAARHLEDGVDATVRAHWLRVAGDYLALAHRGAASDASG